MSLMACGRKLLRILLVLVLRLWYLLPEASGINSSFYGCEFPLVILLALVWQCLKSMEGGLIFLFFYLCVTVSCFSLKFLYVLSSSALSRMLRRLICGRLGPVWLWKALLLFVVIAFAGQLLGIIFNRRYGVIFNAFLFIL